MSKFEAIAKHFIETIKKSDAYKENKAVSCNDQELLEPNFRAKVKNVLAKCGEAGLNVSARETFRTNALQQHYYNQGFSKIRINGMHHYGIAQDILCLDEKGKVIQNGSDADYLKLREIAKDEGLHLLGLWDAGHVQAVATSEQNAMRLYVQNYRAKGIVILCYGVENHLVGNLKAALQSLGYLSKEYDPQNYFFGSDTKDAVANIQRDNGLDDDGVVGRATYDLFSSKGFKISS